MVYPRVLPLHYTRDDLSHVTLISKLRRNLGYHAPACLELQVVDRPILGKHLSAPEFPSYSSTPNHSH